MEWLQRFWSQVSGLWQGMSGPQRFGLVVVALVAVGGIGGLAYYQLRTDYRPLYVNVPPEEANKITTAMTAKSIPFRLDNNGTTISVPAERYAAAKVELAGEPISSAGGKGFEIFDESPLGMTPFVQNVNYSRALQAELGRSIAQLEPVAQARVHIVRPEVTPFVREQKPTTASVVLRLKPNAQLNRSSAAAIVALVSRAVEGLNPDHVTIVDTRGRLLSDTQPGEDKAQNVPFEIRREMETYLAAKAEELLRRHLGISRAIVRVAAEVNAQRVKEKSETYNPEAKAILAERVSTQKTTGAAGGPRGIAGTTSNVGRTTTTAGGAGGSSSQQEKTETDYAVSKTLREQENRANTVERLTVAALVDLSAQGEGTAKLTLNDARDLIKQAIGFREGRDEIKITDVSMGTPEEPPPEIDEEAVRTQQILGYVRNGSLIVGLLLLLLLAILVTRRMIRAMRTPAPEPAAAAPKASREVDEFRQLAEREPDRVAWILTRMLEGTG